MHISQLHWSGACSSININSLNYSTDGRARFLAELLFRMQYQEIPVSGSLLEKHSTLGGVIGRDTNPYMAHIVVSVLDDQTTAINCFKELGFQFTELRWNDKNSTECRLGFGHVKDTNIKLLDLLENDVAIKEQYDRLFRSYFKDGVARIRTF